MQLLRTIVNNGRSVLSLVRDDKGDQYIIKTCASEHPGLQEQAQLLNEAEIGNALEHPGIRSKSEQVFFKGRQGIRLEYIEGQDCSSLVPMPIPAFFELAIQVSKALSYLHEEGVLHRDINIFNILYDEKQQLYRIIDFGQAVRLPLESRKGGGMPAYMAPETSGRIKAKTDHRADLYSLGVVFYELLCGQNPFKDVSLTKTIHKHIAWMPEEPESVRSAVPVTLSRICMKLLAKNPANRYEDGFALQADLEEARVLYRRNIEPQDFVAGQHHKRAPFNENPPLVVYARQKTALEEHFKAATEGKTRLSMLKGKPGSGKSALIDYLLPSMLAANSMYVSISPENTVEKPFGQLFALLERILQQTANEPQSQIERRKAVLNADDMSRLDFLRSSITGLSHFISGTERKEVSGSLESQNRLQLALQDLLRGLALPESPIVAHFSDASSVDKETLSFLRDFSTNLRSEFVWIILEINSVNPAAQDEWADWHEIFGNIIMDAVDDFQIETICRSMLNAKVKESGELITEVLKYARGVPGKAVELLRYWHSKQFIIYHPGNDEWDLVRPGDDTPFYPATSWDEDLTLDEKKRELLVWMELIGDYVNPELLARLSEMEQGSVETELGELVLWGVVSTYTNSDGQETFRKAYDSGPKFINEIADEELAKKHYSIAKQLLKDQQDETFRIAHHINRAIELGESRISTDLHCEVNVDAGLRAKEEGAFDSSRRYLRNVLDIKGLERVSELDRAFQLFLNIAELSQLEGKLEESDHFFGKALSLANNDLEKAGLYSRRILLFNHQGKLHEAFEIGLKALEILGFGIPRKGNKLKLLSRLIQLRLQIGRRKAEDLLNLPDADDPAAILALRILEDLHPATFHIDPDLLIIQLIHALQITLKKGNAPEGYSAYTGFGAVLALGFKDYRRGWEYTLAGSEMTRKFPDKLYQGRGLFSKGAWIINYVMHARESRPVLEEAYKLSIDSGDFTYATYSAQNLMELHFALGTNLKEFKELVEEYMEFTFKIDYDDILHLSLSTMQLICFLKDEDEEASNLQGKWFKGRDLDQYSKETSYTHARLYYLLIHAFINYLDGKAEQAQEYLELSDSLLYTLQGPAIIVDYYLINGLVAYEILQGGSEKNQKDIRKRLLTSIKKLRAFAKLVPENFSHKYELIRSLEIHLSGDLYKSRKMMRKAMEEASEAGYTHIEAISAMFLASWYKEEGVNDYYRLHAKAAHNAFERWGASRLVSRVLDLFPDALPQGMKSSYPEQTGSYPASYGYNYEYGYGDLNLDPAAVINAASLIAAETDLESLLSAMSRLISEHAGSSRTLLYIIHNEDARLLLESTDKEYSYHPYPGLALAGSDQSPETLILHVKRSRDFVIIDDTSKDNRFSNDSYFRDKASFSLATFPLLHRGSLLGIMYLENTLLTNAFPEERTGFLKMLSSQFAVALQNARLVEDLEIMVRNRTEELKTEKERADLLLRNIMPVETAEELKNTGKATPRQYENVTVLFTDFKDFTRISEAMDPQDLVTMLDFYFREFDKIFARNGLEKIKTIGDAYLAVAGIPNHQDDHAIRAARTALEIIDFMKQTREEGRYLLELRIGMHSGPVIAGVVGEDKFAFDIWGDTVNTAARLETASEAGRINISKTTRDALGDYPGFSYTHRGSLPAKNKGEIDMYFLKKEESHSTENPRNEAVIQMLRKLEQGLDSSLHYHTPKHTRYVMEKAIYIAGLENCPADKLDLIKVAAAYHDAGFLKTYRGHEAESCKIARKELPGYGYSDEDIERICSMILATRIPQEPKDKAEKILCDADLFYLGTDDYDEISVGLQKEFLGKGIISDEKEWLKVQIDFLEKHQFHTESVQKLCDQKKAENLEKLKMLQKG